jgi:hypothetical protein
MWAGFHPIMGETAAGASFVVFAEAIVSKTRSDPLPLHGQPRREAKAVKTETKRNRKTKPELSFRDPKIVGIIGD